MAEPRLKRATSRPASTSSAMRPPLAGPSVQTIFARRGDNPGDPPSPLDTPDRDDPFPPPDRSRSMVCQDSDRAVGGIGEGSVVAPHRNLSTPAAALRPSAIAQTISD